MICVSCRADWCWLCGSDISRSATGHDPDHHYSPTNCFGCMGSQFSQGNGEFLLLDRAASVLWWALFFAVALATAFGYLSAVAALSIATGGCCFCCFNCFGRGFLEFLRDNDVLQALLLGPPLVVSLLIMTVLWFVLAGLWSLVLTPVIILASPLWLPLVACGAVKCEDVLRLWGFCAIYLKNSMAVQMIINGGEMDGLDD